MVSKKRIAWIDIAKGLAITSIVIGHVLKSGAIHNMVYYYHVPVFFFLSGIIVKPEISLKRVKNDFIRIMIPYYCFGIVSILIYCLMGDIAGSKLGERTSVSVLRCILELLYGSCRGAALQFNRPLWFLPSLFVTKLLIYILYYVASGKKLCIALLTISLCIFSCWYTENNHFPLPFSMELSLKLIPFFQLGYFCSSKLRSLQILKDNRLTLFLVGCVLFLLTVFCAYLSPAVNYTSNTFPKPFVFYCVASLGCTSLVIISASVENCRFLTYLGNKTLPILLMHKFPIVFFQIIEPFRTFLMNPDSLEGIISAVFVTMATIILCLYADKVIGNIMPLALGYPKRKI